MKKFTGQLLLYFFVFLSSVIVIVLVVELYHRFRDELKQFEYFSVLMTGLGFAALSLLHSGSSGYCTWAQLNKPRIYLARGSAVISFFSFLIAVLFFAVNLKTAFVSVTFFLAAFSICCDFNSETEAFLFCNDISSEESFPDDYPCILKNFEDDFINFKAFLDNSDSQFCLKIENEVLESNCNVEEKNSFVENVGQIFFVISMTIATIFLIITLLEFMNFFIQICNNEKEEEEESETKRTDHSKTKETSESVVTSSL